MRIPKSFQPLFVFVLFFGLLMQVKLILYIENIADDPKDDPKKLSARQYDILKVISENNEITREQISQKSGVSDSTVKRELNALKDMNILDREGGKTYGKWIIKTDE